MKIDISLTDFVDFAMKSGTPKVTKVSEMKDRPDYQPAFDFYKRFREGLVEAHRGGEGISVIAAMVRSQTDPKKRAQYEEIASAYKSWCGRKSLVWFEPPRDELRVGDVRMRLNPELGLTIQGVPHVIKLYFKPEKLPRNRAEMIAYLMAKELGAKAPEAAFSILDVRRKNLMTPSSDPKRLGTLLAGELAALEAMWDSA